MLRLASARFVALIALCATGAVPLAAQARRDWMLGPFEKPRAVEPGPHAARDVHLPLAAQRQHVRWEEHATFNPGAVARGGKVVCSIAPRTIPARARSAITPRGSASPRAQDGLHFTRRDAPVLFPDRDAQQRNEWPGGVEDPRLVRPRTALRADLHAVEPRRASARRRHLARSRDVDEARARVRRRGERKYLAMETKSGAILTRRVGDRLVATRVNGKYWMYFNVPDILVATSDDLIHWTPLADADGKLVKVLSARPGYFDSWLVEAGPPAVLTERGIVLLYNAGNSAEFGAPGLPARVYTGGQALFDPRNPSSSSTAPTRRSSGPRSRTSERASTRRARRSSRRWCRSGGDGSCTTGWPIRGSGWRLGQR